MVRTSSVKHIKLKLFPVSYHPAVFCTTHRLSVPVGSHCVFSPADAPCLCERIPLPVLGTWAVPAPWDHTVHVCKWLPLPSCWGAPVSCCPHGAWYIQRCVLDLWLLNLPGSPSPQLLLHPLRIKYVQHLQRDGLRIDPSPS